MGLFLYVIYFFSQERVFSWIVIDWHPYIKTSSVCCSFCIAFWVRYFSNLIHFCCLWSDKSENITKIKSIFHFYSHTMTRLIIFTNDPNKIFLFEFRILIIVDSICTWITDEKSWSISAIGYCKEFSRECFAIVWEILFNTIESFSISTPYSCKIVDSFAASFHLETDNTSLFHLLEIVE